jgi:hypothetical protein
MDVSIALLYIYWFAILALMFISVHVLLRNFQRMPPQEASDSNSLSSYNAIRRNALRKVFHFSLFLIFLPAVCVRTDYFAVFLLLLLAIFIIVEAIRASYCSSIFSTLLDTYFENFIDSRDGPEFVASHIYLLLGSALPLWLRDKSQAHYAQIFYSLSGILTLGIQDSMVPFRFHCFIEPLFIG